MRAAIFKPFLVQILTGRMYSVWVSALNEQQAVHKALRRHLDSAEAVFKLRINNRLAVEVPLSEVRPTTDPDTKIELLIALYLRAYLGRKEEPAHLRHIRKLLVEATIGEPDPDQRLAAYGVLTEGSSWTYPEEIS